MAALARAGSVVALLVLLVLALVPTWPGLGAGPALGPGPPVVQAASANSGVAPADALSAHVSADRSAADVGQSITFACSASGGTPPYVYAWTLSDGGIGTGPTVTHSFSSPGTYEATCTVTDLFLGIASASKSVVISPLPSVAASVDHDLAAPGTVLTFSASPSGGDGSFSYEWTFDDGSSGSGAPATHAYTAAGSYQATVTATDGNGGTASSSTSVTISNIGVTAGVSPTSGDATTVFTFTASASGGSGSPYSFSWAFGDGTTGTGSPASHSYSAGGIYSPAVTATDSLGGTKVTQTQTVSVTAPPAPLGASVSAPRQAADVGQSVSFTCSATGGAAPYSYGWTFGDGNTGSGPAVNHVYQSAGAMTVTCTATDSASASAAASKSVDVSPSPSVAAHANPSAAAPGTSLTFSAQATGGPGGFTDYAWSLGDGATGSGIQVAHAFAQPGSYQANVVVTDANGGTASGSVSVTISNIQVTASGTPASGNTDTSFEFSATATGGGGDPFSYSWDFGDGQSDAGPAVSHRYPTPGNYAPSVRATDSLGAGRTVALSPIAVSSLSGPPPQPLSVTMSMSTSLPRVNESASLSGTGHGGAGGYTCSWDFGDGRNSTACSTSHAWAAVGHYVVVVTLSDSGGNRTSDTRTVDVQPNLGPPGGPLNVTFRMSTSLAAVNETVSFIATGGGGSGGYTCSWDFGDNTSATGCSSSHAWHATGSYRVLLSVSDSSGHHGSSAQSVDVIVALTASFRVGPTPAIVGETAQIIAHPTGGIGPYNCTWDFGDASGATGCAVSHVWTTRGRYTIQLSVNDSANQSYAAAETIAVESSGLFGLPLGVDLIVLATPLVAALLGFYLWSVWRTRRRVPRAPDSVEASVMSTLMGNVKRLSRWRPRRGAGHRLSRLPGKESGSEADQGAGGGDHQGPVQ